MVTLTQNFTIPLVMESQLILCSSDRCLKYRQITLEAYYIVITLSLSYIIITLSLLYIIIHYHYYITLSLHYHYQTFLITQNINFHSSSHQKNRRFLTGECDVRHRAVVNNDGNKLLRKFDTQTIVAQILQVKANERKEQKNDWKIRGKTDDVSAWRIKSKPP